ncbi:hypothetical protein V2J56_03135 [Georgenia sp. MJ206]|uniref:hypothetical protein n=1 Tax=Georgenia wangjunii TaxID=3117730 RepID=UPI002F26721C
MSFCPSCHNYLGWADTQSIARVEEEPVRTGAPGVATPARTPVRPAGAGPVGDRPQPTGAVAAVGLALSVSRLEVDPGATATVTATVRNHGSLVDEFVVRVEGPASAWATVDPARTAVYPAGETSFTIDFTPPRDAPITAGTVPFSVTVHSVVHAGTGAEERGTIAVAAVTRLGVDVVPDRQRAMTSAGYHVALHNRGNHDTDVQLRPSGAHHELDLRIAPERLRVPAFGEAVVSLELVVPGGGTVHSRVHQFQVQAVVDEHGEESVAGAADVVLVHEPPPPPPWYVATVVGWLVGGLVLGVLVGVLAAGAVAGLAALTTGTVPLGSVVTAGVAGGSGGAVVGSVLGIRRALRARTAPRIGRTCVLAGVITLVWAGGLVAAVPAGAAAAVVLLAVANPALAARWLALRGLPAPPPKHAPAPALTAPRDAPAALRGRERPPERPLQRQALTGGTREAPVVRPPPLGAAAPPPAGAGTPAATTSRRRTGVALGALAAVVVLAFVLLGLPGTTVTGLNVRDAPNGEVSGAPLQEGAFVTVRCQVDAFWVAISLPRPGYVFIGDGNVSFPAARPCLGADGGL